jgi:hypothetical protein
MMIIYFDLIRSILDGFRIFIQGQPGLDNGFRVEGVICLIRRKGPMRNSLLHFVFLFIAFIYFVKRESEMNWSSDYNTFSLQTYGSLVVENRNTTGAFIQYYRSLRIFTDRYQFSDLSPGTTGYLTLKFAFQSDGEILHNTIQNYSPHIHILNMLQRQNIWHQSSEDAIPPVLC